MVAPSYHLDHILTTISIISTLGWLMRAWIHWKANALGKLFSNVNNEVYLLEIGYFLKLNSSYLAFLFSVFTSFFALVANDFHLQNLSCSRNLLFTAIYIVKCNVPFASLLWPENRICTRYHCQNLDPKAGFSLKMIIILTINLTHQNFEASNARFYTLTIFTTFRLGYNGPNCYSSKSIFDLYKKYKGL